MTCSQRIHSLQYAIWKDLLTHLRVAPLPVQREELRKQGAPAWFIRQHCS